MISMRTPTSKAPTRNWRYGPGSSLVNILNMEEDGPLLCCCEYYNIRKQRVHLLTFCCECDEFDKAADDWLKGNPQTLATLTTIVDVISDRCRVPWVGGAQQFDTGLIFPPFILILSAYIACMHFVFTILVFLGLPAVVLCCYVFTIRVKMTTRFFLSLSVTSTVGCFAVYFYYVASSKPFLTNVSLVASGIAMTVCFILSRRKPSSHYLGSLKTNYSKNTFVNLENSGLLTFCEVCNHDIPPRAKHCRICKCCILKYDHHCVWIDCCIGYHNHKIFVLTVFLYLVNIFTGCLVSLSFACEWENGQIPDCSHAYSSDSSAFVFVVCCCYTLLAGVALSILLVQQLILISFNMTSYEWRYMQDQQSCWKTMTSSPHNKGIVRNWSEFLSM